jgi:hypothetical protein
LRILVRYKNKRFNIKKKYKIPLILTGSFLLLGILFFGVLSTSYVQTQIVKQITKNFTQTTQQQILFEDLKLRWNGKLEFNNFYLEDHHQDTLFFIKALRTSLLDFKGLQQNHFDFSRLEAEGFFMKLKKYQGEETHSLKILLEKFKKDSSKKRKTRFKIDDLNLADVSFVYQEEDQTVAKPLRLDSLNLSAYDFLFEENQLKVQLDNLEGVMHAPLAKPLRTKALVHYEPGRLQLNEWQLVSKESKLTGSLELLGADGSLRNFKSTGELKVNVVSSHLDFATFFPEDPNLKNIPTLEASFKAQGKLQEIELTPLVLSHPYLNFDGSLTVKNVFDTQSPEWKLTLDLLQIDTRIMNSLTIIPNPVKDQLTRVSNLKLNGVTSINSDSIQFDLKTNNSWGKIYINGSLGKGVLDQSKSEKWFTVNALITDLSLSPWVAKNLGMNFGGTLQAQGDFSEKQNPQFSWQVDRASMTSKRFSLSGIALEGKLEQQQLRNTLSINSVPVKLKSDLLYNYQSTPPQTTVLANISQWDLNEVGLQLDLGKRNFKGVILSNFSGNSIDELEGEIKISSASIENEQQTVTLNPISIRQKLEGSQTHLTIDNTDCIAGEAKGQFETSKLSALLQHTFHQVYPFLPDIEVAQDQEVFFKLKIYEKLLDALYPSFSISENIALNGKIDSAQGRSQFVLDAPLLRYKDIQFQKLHFQVDTKNPIYNTFLSVAQVSHQYYKGKDFNLISTQLQDTLFFRSEFEGTAAAKSPFEVNFYHTRESNGTSHFGVKKSVVPLGSDTWTVNPENNNKQKLSYFPSNKQTRLSALKAISGDQSIALSGTYLNSEDFSLNLFVEDLILQNILPSVPNFAIAGKGNLEFIIVRSTKQNKLGVNATIDSLSINREGLGDLTLTTNGNTQRNTYFANLDVKQLGEKKLELNGLWQGLEEPILNLNLKLNDLDLAFLSPLGKKAVNKIRGKVGGEVTLWGPLKDLKHEGTLDWTRGGFGVPFLNLDYEIEPTQVRLSNQTFNFKTVVLNDTDQGTSAVLNGNFSHTNFSNWVTDLEISSDRMLLLNKEQQPESLFFGEGFLKGTVRLQGPTKELQISLQGATEQGTSIKIPWSENYGLSDTSFVRFVNKYAKDGNRKETVQQRIEEVKGLELDFELDVNNKAIVEIVIDQETGSYLSGRGAGNLFMEVNTLGKFNMWGDFITYDGIYNFKNLGVIDKKFDVKPGGTIVWEGNPLEAQMDLEAVYDVPGGANPALLLDNPNFNKKIPTEVLIRLQGNLLKPDDPVFEIGFPNTSGTVASEINYRLADPQRSQLQAISLLSQGIFINEVSVSMQGITNNLYQKASDIVSNLISEENDKLKVGIDYLQGDKSALLDIATEDRLGFTLSTKISDKILLNGKIGVPVGGVEQTLIVGNVQIDFILNEEGSLRAKVFNKENEFRYIGDELGYTQGVGLSYDVDFNTFKELIQKITSQNTSDLEILNATGQSEETNLIKFVKKTDL